MPKMHELFKRHSEVRFRQRYDFNLSDEVRASIIKQIEDQRNIAYVKSQGKDRTLYLLIRDEGPIKLVFSRKAHEIITFLPLNHLDEADIKAYNARQKAKPKKAKKAEAAQKKRQTNLDAYYSLIKKLDNKVDDEPVDEDVI